MEQNKNTQLSVNRFKEKDIEQLSPLEYEDYVLSTLMQKVIQVLEGSIQSDRIFSNARFKIFGEFYAARELFVARDNKSDKGD